MPSGSEHYQSAELCITEANYAWDGETDAEGIILREPDHELGEFMLKTAHVHAMLAVAASHKISPTEQATWNRVTSYGGS